MARDPGPWTVSAAYVGAVVGAGFGTGREILQFFAAYGTWGLAGAALAGAGFAWLGAEVLALCARRGLTEHRELYAAVLGPRIAGPLDRATTLFLFIGLAVVLAGSGALAEEAWGLPPLVGELSMAGTVSLVLLAGRRGLLWGNAVLVPLLTAFCLAACLREAVSPSWAARLLAAQADVSRAIGPWYVGSGLYVGYNLLVAVVTLCAASPALTGRRDARLWGALGGACLGLLCLATCATLLGRYDQIASLQVPLARIAASHGSAWAAAYALTLAACVFTTALASAYALAARLAPPAGQPWVAALALFAALPLAGAGLSTLVRSVYPAMGVVGTVLLAGLLLRGLRRP